MSQPLRFLAGFSGSPFGLEKKRAKNQPGMVAEPGGRQKESTGSTSIAVSLTIGLLLIFSWFFSVIPAKAGIQAW
ncbi:MAG: hypothetical protein FP813_07490 [Desulfurivibrio sp.]|nr:hypothetical protein [Desulfurivibrio sp.]MBU3937064.1 hypothetical protein [Pseudomonadota bacterium]MBU4119207.1 hypothetical protein [Pseudomonadota bacterium]